MAQQDDETTADDVDGGQRYADAVKLCDDIIAGVRTLC